MKKYEFNFFENNVKYLIYLWMSLMIKFPLLLLPGLLCDAEVWAYQIRVLANFADIYIPNLNNATSPDEMVASVLHHAPDYFVLAGHSMGGWVALEVMKHCPERVLGLALLNTTAFPDSKEKQEARKSMIIEAQKGEYKKIIDKLMKLFVYNTKVFDEVRTMLERNQSAFMHQEKAMMARADCIDVLENITCPTLIIHSENDAVFHFEDANLLATKIKNSTFHIIKKCGHMSPMESKEEVSYFMKNWFEAIFAFYRSRNTIFHPKNEIH